MTEIPDEIMAKARLEAGSAEIEWSFHEDRAYPPRDFWHAMIVWRGLHSEWHQVGEMEKRDLPLGLKSETETRLRRELSENIAALLSERTASEAALKENERLRALMEEAREVLRPFVDHLNEMRFDLDNKGNPLPDEATVGWIYVTNGHFRAARAFLAKTGGA